MTTLALFFMCLGSFLLGVGGTLLVVYWLVRKAEHEDFRNFWGP